MICDHWDIVTVPFPFIDLPISKKRPALVISSKTFNSENRHSIFAMITTAKSSDWQSDHLLAAPEASGLVKNCYVRWKTFTLPNELIIGLLGRLSSQDKEILTTQVRKIFAPA